MVSKLESSLIEEYWATEERKHFFGDEHGFITYRIIGKECFITDPFVREESRKQGHGQRFGNAVHTQS